MSNLLTQELERGSVVVERKDGGYAGIVNPGDSLRIFTRNLLGCTAIAYTALRKDSTRMVHFQHADSMDVVRNRVRVPWNAAGVVALTAVAMTKSTQPKTGEPYPASELPQRCSELYMGERLNDLVSQLSARGMDTTRMTVIPYGVSIEQENPYANTLTLDLAPSGLGTFYADGKYVISTSENGLPYVAPPLFEK